MKLHLQNQSHVFENSDNGIQKLIEFINEALSNENLFFSHLVIDGQDIYENHEVYMAENINVIKEVKVVTNTIEEFVNNLVVTLNDYTARGIPEIEKLINDFYQTPTEESWNTLNQLLEGIDWIYRSIKSIDMTKHSIAGWDEFIKSTASFETELPNLLNAITNRDLILIADIIQYEILPQFQIINAETEKNFEVK